MVDWLIDWIGRSVDRLIDWLIGVIYRWWLSSRFCVETIATVFDEDNQSLKYIFFQGEKKLMETGGGGGMGAHLTTFSSIFPGLYHSLVHQLYLNGTVISVPELRKRTAQYMEKHPDYFKPFLVHHDTGNPFTAEDFAQYLHDLIHTNVWGSQVELRAISADFKWPIRVVQAEGTHVLDWRGIRGWWGHGAADHRLPPPWAQSRGALQLCDAQVICEDVSGPIHSFGPCAWWSVINPHVFPSELSLGPAFLGTAKMVDSRFNGGFWSIFAKNFALCLCGTAVFFCVSKLWK